MIISKGRAYVFVHIPKTGGTSLAHALEDRAMRDDILIGDTPKAKRRKGRLQNLQTAGRLWKHSTLADIDGLLSPADIDQMYVFTLVRNPWDRLVSYYHWLKEQAFDHPAVALAKSAEFSDFLDTALIRDSFAAAPFASYMTTATGQERCQAYIRLENFAHDAEPLFEHLGFEVTLAHHNVSRRHRDYRSYYTRHTEAIVAEVCRADIDRFGYQFDAFLA